MALKGSANFGPRGSTALGFGGHAHRAFPPLIANVLYLSTYLEKWGSGVARIIEACKEQGVPEPTYEDRGGFIHIVFKRKSYIQANKTDNDTQDYENGRQKSENVDRKSRQKSEKVDRKSRQKNENVDRKGGQKTREAIFDLITANSKITSAQIAEILGIHRSGVARHLKKLQEEGLIKREGPDNGGQWIVIKN